jgi:poly(3-hydroxybutyrate) depolymerase
VGQSTEVKGKYGGIEYTWRVYVPSTYEESTPVPLVTQHHGWGMTASSEESGSGISLYAEQYGFIAVFPQGQGDNVHKGGPWYSWNVVGSTLSPGPEQPTCTEKAGTSDYCYESCGACGDKPQCWWTTCYNDVTPNGTGYEPLDGFIPALYDTLESQLCIDTTREFAAGESNGGMMAYQLAVDLADRLAAVVSEFGSFHYQFAMAPKRSVPFLVFHGTKDTTVPQNVSLSGDGYYYTTAHDIFYGSQYSDGFRSANGCSGDAKHYPTTFDGEYELWCMSTGDCTGGDLVRCAWNGGHNWYGNNPTSNGGLVSEFLLKWSKPGHVGFGAQLGEVRKPKLIQDVTIQPKRGRLSAWENVAATVVPTKKGHYGDPAEGCLDDEHEVELGDGKSCMPIIGSSNISNGLPVPDCIIGGVGPVEDNGCPGDADVVPGSKAFPLCLARGSSNDPYTNGEFHCVLACPCEQIEDDGSCSPDSHWHCPGSATCQLGELRHRGQGVCVYPAQSPSALVV